MCFQISLKIIWFEIICGDMDGVKKENRGMRFLLLLAASPGRRPARQRAISLVVEHAPDNCVVVLGL